jgi:hypothetical protein
MGWSLLSNALRPFKIYCAPLTIILQLVLFLWQTIEIDSLGHLRVVEALQTFVQKCDPVILSEIRIHIAGVSFYYFLLTLKFYRHRSLQENNIVE